jgi:hypothetical protein
MADWNEQAAPNNNLPAKSIRSSLSNKQYTTTNNKSFKKSSDNRK